MILCKRLIEVLYNTSLTLVRYTDIIIQKSEIEV